MRHSVLSRPGRTWFASLAIATAFVMFVGSSAAFAAPASKSKPAAAQKKAKRAAATISVTGTLEVTTGKKGKITSVKLVTESDGIYNVSKDKRGRALAKAFNGKQVELQAVVSHKRVKKGKEKARWLRVKSFAEVTSDEAPTIEVDDPDDYWNGENTPPD